jgi:hypothetical protein
MGQAIRRRFSKYINLWDHDSWGEKKRNHKDL